MKPQRFSADLAVRLPLSVQLAMFGLVRELTAARTTNFGDRH